MTDRLAAPSGDPREAKGFTGCVRTPQWFPAAAGGRTAVKVGDRVPDFEALDQHGNTLVLRELLEWGPVVVYFYAKAMTRG